MLTTVNLQHWIRDRHRGDVRQPGRARQLGRPHRRAGQQVGSKYFSPFDKYFCVVFQTGGLRHGSHQRDGREGERHRLHRALLRPGACSHHYLSIISTIYDIYYPLSHANCKLQKLGHLWKIQEISYKIGTRILKIDLEIAEIIEVKVATFNIEIIFLRLCNSKMFNF